METHKKAGRQCRPAAVRSVQGPRINSAARIPIPEKRSRLPEQDAPRVVVIAAAGPHDPDQAQHIAYDPVVETDGFQAAPSLPAQRPALIFGLLATAMTRSIFKLQLHGAGQVAAHGGFGDCVRSIARCHARRTGDENRHANDSGKPK